MKVIGSNEDGGVGEESNVTKSDECTKSFQNVVGRISAVEFNKKCCENRERQRPISSISRMCTVNVRGRGHRVIPSFQRHGWVSDTRDCARKNLNGRVLTSSVLCYGRSWFWMLPQCVVWLAL